MIFSVRIAWVQTLIQDLLYFILCFCSFLILAFCFETRGVRSTQPFQKLPSSFPGYFHLPQPYTNRDVRKSEAICEPALNSVYCGLCRIQSRGARCTWWSRLRDGHRPCWLSVAMVWSGSFHSCHSLFTWCLPRSRRGQECWCALPGARIGRCMLALHSLPCASWLDGRSRRFLFFSVWSRWRPEAAVSVLCLVLVCFPFSAFGILAASWRFKFSSSSFVVVD